MKFVPVEKSSLYVSDKKREVAIKRCKEYKALIDDYLAVKDSIPCGLDMEDQYQKSKKKIMKLLGANTQDWNNWNWHIRNVIQKDGLEIKNHKSFNIRKSLWHYQSKMGTCILYDKLV